DSLIFEANDAFLTMVGYSRDDLVAGRLRWLELTPPEWQSADQRAVAQIRATGSFDIFEKEYVRKDGSRVPVLIGGAAFEDTRSQSVTFVLDLTERKRTEEALYKAQAELAHINRVTTLGELTASIAHEVNQPLAALTTNATAGLRWLGAAPPNLDEVRDCLGRIARDSTRAGEVIQRLRALAKRAVPVQTRVDLTYTVQEVLPLITPEA